MFTEKLLSRSCESGLVLGSLEMLLYRVVTWSAEWKHRIPAALATREDLLTVSPNVTEPVQSCEEGLLL